MTYKNIMYKTIFSFLFMFFVCSIYAAQSQNNQPTNPPQPCQECDSEWCCNYPTGTQCPNCEDYQCQCDANGCPGDCCYNPKTGATGFCPNSCCNSDGTGCKSCDASHTPMGKPIFHKFPQKSVNK